MDQRGGAHSKGGTKFYEPGWRQLHTSHAYDRFLATSHHYRDKNRKKN